MAPYITLNEVAILSLFCCLSPVIYDGIILLCPLFISALTKWMKQLSSLSAQAAEMWALDFCRWKALAGDQNQWWNVLRNFFLFSSLLPVTMGSWRWIMYPIEQCESYIIVARSNFKRRGSCRWNRAWVLHLVLSEFLIFVFPRMPRPSSLCHPFILHPPARMQHEFFYIINDALLIFSLIKGYLFIHYWINIYWVPSRYWVNLSAMEIKRRNSYGSHSQEMVYSTNRNKPWVLVNVT